MKFAFKQNTPINVRARMSSNELWPGVESVVAIDLDNQSDRCITRGAVRLACYIEAEARQVWSRDWSFPFTADLKDVPGVLPLKEGERRSFEVPFVVPATCGTSLNLNCGSIPWYVSVSLSWGLKTATAKIPVVMQSMCPSSLAWFPAQPVLGVSESYSGPTLFSLLPSDTPMQWWSLLP